MTFYLKPPRGEIHLQKVIDLCQLRCQFLNLLDEANIEEDKLDHFYDKLADFGHLIESVNERSSKDRVSHFMTRMAVSSIHEFAQTFIELETKLFCFRLMSLEKSQILVSLLDVERHLAEKFGSNVELTKSVRHIINTKMLTHPCLTSDEDDFTSECCCRLSVPFELVPKLVSKRDVIVTAGRALISCKQVTKFLASVFENILRHSVNETAYVVARNDDDDDQRIQILSSQIRQHFKTILMKRHGRESLSNVKVLRASDVDRVSSHFPLCFSRVYSDLRRHHRLQHHARVAFTLFLKEIGLPRVEAVTFWREFYSRDATGGCTSCCHSWEQDGKKFLYSISHLYGEAGGRKNYSAHSCASIIGRGSSPREQLVCPFAVYDASDLRKVLKDENIEDGVIENVVKMRNDPQKNCAEMMKLIRLKEEFQSRNSDGSIDMFVDTDCSNSSNPETVPDNESGADIRIVTKPSRYFRTLFKD